MGRRRPGGHFAVLLLGAALGACVLGARGDRLAFPKTTDAAILEEDLEFCRTLGAQARPEPPADGWNGPLTGVPKGMLVYGKMDSDGDGPPAAKFFVVGTLANVSSAAMIATVEGIDFDERRRWDPSCMLLKPLHTDGEDDVVQWRSDFPWPLSDREFVYRRRLVQDGAGGAIAVTKAIKASSEWLPVEKSVIRIRDFLQYTSVRPLDDGSGCSFAMLYRNNMEAPLPQWVVDWFGSAGTNSQKSRLHSGCI